MAWVKEFWKECSKDIATGLLKKVIWGLFVVVFGVAAAYCTTEVTLARYWLLIIIGGTVVLCFGCFLAYSFFKSRKMPYDKDEVFGLIWVRGEQEYTGTPYLLQARCPKCQAAIDSKRYDGTKYVCPRCGVSLSCDKRAFNEKEVREEFERRIDNNDCKFAGKRLKKLAKEYGSTKFCN